jgi:hypothetical protein
VGKKQNKKPQERNQEDEPYLWTRNNQHSLRLNLQIRTFVSLEPCWTLVESKIITLNGYLDDAQPWCRRNQEARGVGAMAANQDDSAHHSFASQLRRPNFNGNSQMIQEA